MEITLKNKTALITGGSKGLGLAMAQKMAAAGANVVILARGGDRLQQAQAEIEKGIDKTPGATNQVLALSCDVTKVEDLEKCKEQILSRFSGLDILVNNAGQSFAKPFMDLSVEDFQKDFDLKLYSAIRLIKMFWPMMQKQNWGRVINVLHIGAKAPAGGSGPSAVSRAAGLALTKILSHEGAKNNILVNALLVGLIESDQWVRKAQNQNQDLSVMLSAMAEKIPMGRVGQAEEFANMACFLASEQASYITGTAINVDGGMSPVI
jgi:NAD(P)-dependent dehydrogenase (short-subunit alcohol dehydrogenase family)